MDDNECFLWMILRVIVYNFNLKIDLIKFLVDVVMCEFVVDEVDLVIVLYDWLIIFMLGKVLNVIVGFVFFVKE